MEPPLKVLVTVIPAELEGFVSTTVGSGRYVVKIVTGTGVLSAPCPELLSSPTSINDFPMSSIAVPSWVWLGGFTAEVFPPQLKKLGLDSLRRDKNADKQTYLQGCNRGRTVC